MMMVIYHFSTKDKDAKEALPGSDMNSTHVVVLEMKYGTPGNAF